MFYHDMRLFSGNFSNTFEYKQDRELWSSSFEREGQMMYLCVFLVHSLLFV